MSERRAAASQGSSEPFAHYALFYAGPEQYAADVGGFVSRAVKGGEPVLVAAPGPRLEALRRSLGADAGPVSWVDMSELGRNPGRVLAALQDFADRWPGRACRIVGEPIWPGRTRPEVLEATRHEALINLAFAGRPAAILCPYDTEGLPPAVVADARRTHPLLVEGGRDLASPEYADPLSVSSDCEPPLPEPAGVTTDLSYAAGEVADVRRHAESWARAAGLDSARRQDLVLAIGEAAANSIAHGGGRGRLRMWTAEDGSVVAEIRDEGLLHNPLAGRRRPRSTSAEGGRGLWLIHQLCDLVEIRSAGSLTLRLHMTA